MKLIKTILLATISSCAITYVQAQEIKTEIAKPIEPASNINGPDNKPNPDLTGNKRTQEQPVLKESTEKPVLVNEKTEPVKPKVAPSENIVRTTLITAEKREDAAKPVPMIPAHSTNASPVPVEKKEAKKNSPPQQQQN